MTAGWRRWLLAGAVLLAGAGTIVLLDRLFPLPMARFFDRSAVVVGEDGGWLRAFPAGDGRWRLLTKPADLPPLFVELLVAAEDRRFSYHPGVDPLALGRAAFQWLRHGEVRSGGSTLTMQVAKLLEPRPRTLAAKAVELLRAVQLTVHHGRDEILAMWLTLAPFGGDLEGVRAAALAWFGKEPRTLAPAEMALLVTLPRSPEQLRPDRHPAAARRARDRLVARLARQGDLDPASAAAAVAAPVPRRRQAFPMLAPHLAERVHAQHIRAGDGAPPGDRLRTTLDAGLQAGLERLLGAGAATLPAPVELAALVMEHESGTVRAWAGSSAYLDRRRQGMVDHVRAIRSPGSTLKPFVYGLAFDRFLAHPQSIAVDEPRRFSDYAPENFDWGFSGDVTLREALQLSLNLPAVTVLERLGPVGFVQALRDTGVGLQLDQERPAGLPVVLGGVGMSLLDLVAGYGAIAGDGRVRPPRVLPDGMTVPGAALLTPEAAGALRAILAGAPRPAGARPRRSFGFKTGTSYRFKDGWAVGFDGRYTVGVWIGRSDAASCGRNCSGFAGAAPLLARVFDLLPETPLLPEPAASPFKDAAPPLLARLDQPMATGTDGAPLEVEFPADRSLLDVASDVAIPLKARGGRLPLRWFVDGVPLDDTRSRRRGSWWQGHGSGWSEITVVDADGRSARAVVRIQAPSVGGGVALGGDLAGGAQHGVPERVPGQEGLDGIGGHGGQDQERVAR
ncbi:penicillin-binding protein 1C [Geminicoccus harenae]|uniref:penicillin-binding protein 1C n=1 Tax=Geminicoccus harenae TaxID=2498453 RepID=UPI002AC34E8D|nr:penicillin-binding protein 1C [Geminicoccus harenae]